MLCFVMPCDAMLGYAIYAMLRFAMLCYAMLALLAGWAGLLGWVASWLAGLAGWLASWLAALAGWAGLGWLEAMPPISWCVDKI